MSRLKVFAILECLLCRCDWQISCNAVIAVIDICTECDHELYGVHVVLPEFLSEEL